MAVETILSKNPKMESSDFARLMAFFVVDFIRSMKGSSLKILRPCFCRAGFVAQSGHSAPSGNTSASNGTARMSSALARVQRPASRVKASSVRASGLTSQRWATALAVEGALFGQVEAAGSGREDLADPVGGEIGEGRVGEDRHARAPPAGEVGDQHVGAEVKLGLDGEVPAGGAGRAAAGPLVEATGHAEGGAGMAQRRAGVEMQAAVRDLGDHVRGRVEHVLIGRGARGAGLGVHRVLARWFIR